MIICREWAGRVEAEAAGLEYTARWRSLSELSQAVAGRIHPPLLLLHLVGEEAAGLQAWSRGALLLRRHRTAAIGCG